MATNSLVNNRVEDASAYCFTVSGWYNVCVYVFRVLLIMNSHLSVQNSAVLCNGGLCFLWGSNWVCIFNIDTLLSGHGALISTIVSRLAPLQQVGCLTKYFNRKERTNKACRTGNLAWCVTVKAETAELSDIFVCSLSYCYVDIRVCSLSYLFVF
jgi:hypothetical protein